MPAGANAKREREFQKLEKAFRQQHRYPGREEEVAARIVNKQRAEYGETRAEKQKDKEGRSPDRGLPLPGYDGMTIPQVLKRAGSMSKAEVGKLRAYEIRHKNRKGLMAKLDRMLDS